MSINLREVFIEFTIEDEQLLRSLSILDEKSESVINNLERLDDIIIRTAQDSSLLATQLRQIENIDLSLGIPSFIETTEELAEPLDRIEDLLNQIEQLGEEELEVTVTPVETEFDKSLVRFEEKLKRLEDVLEISPDIGPNEMPAERRFMTRGDEKGVKIKEIPKIRLAEEFLPIDVRISDESLNRINQIMDKVDLEFDVEPSINKEKLDETIKQMESQVRSIEVPIKPNVELLQKEEIAEELERELINITVDPDLQGLDRPDITNRERQLQEAITEVGLERIVPVEVEPREITELERDDEQREFERILNAVRGIVEDISPTYIESAVKGLEFAEFPELEGLVAPELIDEDESAIIEKEVERRHEIIREIVDRQIPSPTINVGPVTITSGADMDEFQRKLLTTVTKAINEEADRRK